MSSSDPEKYSIDEMMEKLQNRTAEDPNQDGELVTRADGSQAVRVRKRKRRSQQAHKEALNHNRRSKIVQVTISLVALLLVLFACGIAIVYANSAPFRKNLVQKISLLTGANADLRQFRVTPTRANAELLTLTWPEGNALREVSLRRTSAEISPSTFLGKSMRGEDVSLQEVTLGLRHPEAGKPSRISAPDPKNHALLSFKFYNTPKLRVLFGEPTMPFARMENVEATFQPENTKGIPQLLLNRGEITIQGWPKFKLERSHIEFSGDEVDVVGMRLRHDGDNVGVLELSGTLLPYSPDRASLFAIQLQAFPIAGIVGPELGRFFPGHIDTLSSAKSNFLSVKLGPSPDSTLVISYTSSVTAPFEITNFPFLLGLGQILDDKWFERPIFNSEATGNLRRIGGTITLSDINFTDKGRLAIRGNLTMNPDKKLSGILEIGVAESMIGSAKIPKFASMFSAAEGGFRWLPIKISGTATTPADNFRELFEAASIKSEPAKTDSSIPSFEDLTAPK